MARNSDFSFEAAQLLVHLRERAGLALLLRVLGLVLADDVGALDEHGVAVVQEQEHQRDEGGQPVGGEERGDEAHRVRGDRHEDDADARVHGDGAEEDDEV
jgi:hypothetical protein